MRLPLLALFVLLPALCVCQTPAADEWKTVTDLPALDSSGLTAAQKTILLKILREENCTCACSMKVAECRMKDPACGDSRTLAGLAVEQMRAGKTPEEIREALHNSELAKGRMAALMGTPVSIPTGGAPFRGPSGAKVTLVEFSDFQCPYCAAAASKVYALLSAYPFDLKLVFKQFPLETHPQASLAAQAALAAQAQGKFWPLHDRMYANFRKLSRENIATWAKEIGMDMARFNSDLDSGRFKTLVENDLRDGESAGVSGTPSFFINGKQYRGAIEPEAMKPLIDAELKR